MKLTFTKMHACGNDYVYIDCRAAPIQLSTQQIKALCDRHKGIGADGVIYIGASQTADATMQMYNQDGSEAMCGNGVRCVGEYLFSHGLQGETAIVETIAGMKKIVRHAPGWLTVDMGTPELDAKKIPVLGFSGQVINQLAEIRGGGVRISCVSMGNPHCVVFVPNVEQVDVARRGEDFQYARPFPAGVNVEFVQQMDQTTLRMRVFERGTGETLACGTGVCASVVVAVLQGKCSRNTDITVQVPGGTLIANWAKDTVFLTGEAKLVFEGTIEV